MRHREAHRIGCLPNNLARQTIHAHHQRLLTSGSQHHNAIIHTRTLACVPERNLRSKLLLHIHRPLHLARYGIATHNVSLRAYRYDITLAHDGNRTRESVITLHRHAVPATPQLLTRLEREATQSIGVELLVIVQHIDSAVVDNGGGVSLARLEAPHLLELPLQEGLTVRSLYDVGVVLASEAYPLTLKLGLEVLLVSHKVLTHNHIVGLALQPRRSIIRTRVLHRQISYGHTQMPPQDQNQIYRSRSSRNIN